MGHAFSGQFGLESQIVLRKKQKYYAATGELRRYREQTVRLNAHRVSPDNNTSYAVRVWTTNTTNERTHEAAGATMYQAIPDLAGGIASGRTEDPTLFHKKIHNVNFFVKKKQKYHAAAGESGFHRVERPVCLVTA
jgi:hypothetical protein